MPGNFTSEKYTSHMSMSVIILSACVDLQAEL